MQSSLEEITPILGTSMGGGFYAGRIMVNGSPFAIIVSPKALGEHVGIEWIARRKDVPTALSYCDGLANTQAMAEAGSKLAKWAMGLNIAGSTDWYLPSQDELELCYRNLKPTTGENYCWARSGINVSAIPPAYPYTPATPAQTKAESFQAGGAADALQIGKQPTKVAFKKRAADKSKPRFKRKQKAMKAA